jgi:hypothetical protein
MEIRMVSVDSKLIRNRNRWLEEIEVYQFEINSYGWWNLSKIRFRQTSTGSGLDRSRNYNAYIKYRICRKFMEGGKDQRIRLLSIQTNKNKVDLKREHQVIQKFAILENILF